MTEYERGYEDGRKAGRRAAAEILRIMLGRLIRSRDQDVSRTASLLLEGFSAQLDLAPQKDLGK